MTLRPASIARSRHSSALARPSASRPIRNDSRTTPTILPLPTGESPMWPTSIHCDGPPSPGALAAI